MRVKTKKSEEEVRRTLFGPINKAAKTARPWTEVQPTWCDLSEMRLFTKIIAHKPAGVNKHFNLAIIVDYMSNVYEDEEIDFEEYLRPEHVITIKKRRENGKEYGEALSFPPKYKIRPTMSQVIQRLNELYDMTRLDEYEPIPEGLDYQMDFYLPDGEFGELLQKQESDRLNAEAMAPPPEIRQIPRGSLSSGPPKKKRRRGSTDSSSRASTPYQHKRFEVDI